MFTLDTKSPTAATLFSSRRKRSAVLSLLLALGTLAVWNSIVHNGFINIDDNLYLLDNAHVHQGLSWATVKWAFTTCEQANWHPLTWLSHALDWQLFGRNAGGHHYMGVLFHAINVVLLFLLLESATGFTWRSLIVAALFSVHPVNVESVAWAAERKNLLSMMFFLLAMLAYGWYARRPSLRRYGSVFLLFACALMAKPQAVTLPCVLLLWDYWPLRRFGARDEAETTSDFAPRPLGWLLLEKIPLLLLSAADAAITMYAQRQGSAVRTLSEYSLHARIENAVVSYARYVGHAFWPVHLSPTYAHPGEAIPLSHVLGSAAFLLLITALVFAGGRRYVIVGWLWFVGILVPMIGILQVGNQAMADRYAYIPYIGLFWIVVWALAEFAQNWRVAPQWIAVPVCLVLAANVWVTRTQILNWHDSDTLWMYAIRVDYFDWMARSNLCGMLVTENRPDEAVAQYNIIKEIHQYPLTEILRFADYELRHGHVSEAVTEVRGVLRQTPDPQLRADAFVDLGVADLAFDNITAAQEDFESARRENPHTSGALLGLGLVAGRSGDFSKAADYYVRAVNNEPTDIGYFLLSVALEKTGHRDEARAAYGQAQSLSRDMGAVLRRASSLTGIRFTPQAGN